MQLDCYKIYEQAPEIIPGRSRREWMDEFTHRHPYRCLPLTMANSTGWEILCPIDIEIEWDGRKEIDAVKVTSSAGEAAVASFSGSHFGGGIVTMHTGHLFRTPPGWAVWCMGAPNEPKDGIAPLSGLVETDWLPFPFTMNWQMTRRGKVRFEQGESFCFFTVIEHHQLEEIQPELRMLDDNTALKSEYETWRDSRAEFSAKLAGLDPDTVRAGWQRHYMRGNTASGGKSEVDHKTKRQLKTPRIAKP